MRAEVRGHGRVVMKSIDSAAILIAHTDFVSRIGYKISMYKITRLRHITPFVSIE